MNIDFILYEPIDDVLEHYNDELFNELYERIELFLFHIIQSSDSSDEVISDTYQLFLTLSGKKDSGFLGIREHIESCVHNSPTDGDLVQCLREAITRLYILGLYSSDNI